MCRFQKISNCKSPVPYADEIVDPGLWGPKSFQISLHLNSNGNGQKQDVIAMPCTNQVILTVYKSVCIVSLYFLCTMPLKSPIVKLKCFPMADAEKSQVLWIVFPLVTFGRERGHHNSEFYRSSSSTSRKGIKRNKDSLFLRLVGRRAWSSALWGKNFLEILCITTIMAPPMSSMVYKIPTMMPNTVQAIFLKSCHCLHFRRGRGISVGVAGLIHRATAYHTGGGCALIVFTSIAFATWVFASSNFFVLFENWERNG